MRKLLSLFLCLVPFLGFAQTNKISDFPNTNTLANTNLFLIAIKGSPGTNMNISWGQLRLLILTDTTNVALSTTNFDVITATNFNVDSIHYTQNTSNVHSGAVTNFALDSDRAELIINATNGFTLTNFLNLEAGEGTVSKYVNVEVIGQSNAMPAITFPTLGAASYSVRVWTNDARPIITLATNGVRIHYLLKFRGTNITIANCATF